MKFTKLKIITLVIFCSICLTNKFPQTISSESPTISIVEIDIKALTSYVPIEINGNADLETQAIGKWDEGGTSDGTAAHPYIIKDYLISTTSPAINIRGTTHHLRIENCHINGSINAITLNDVENGVIYKCNLTANVIGITINNTSTQNSVVECTIYLATTGIFMHHCDGNTVIDSSIKNAQDDGIYVGEGIFNEFTDNFFMHNTMALNLQDSVNNSIIKNSINNSTEHGIYLVSTHSTLIEKNNLSCNFQYGLKIQSGENNEIEKNNFIGNFAPDSQAYDSGLSNFFSCNYWSDWISPDVDGDGFVDNPYIIPTSNVEDSYPLVSKIVDFDSFNCPTPLFGFSHSIIVVSFLVMVFGSFIYKKRKKPNQKD